MAAKPDRDAGYQLARAVILFFLWGLFIVALVMSAREGVAFARKNMSARGDGSILFTPGTTVTVDAERKAVAFGTDPKALRQYFLNFAVRGGADPTDRLPGIVMMKGAIKVNALDGDGNLVEVRIAEGEHRGQIFWVRRDRIRLSD